MERDRRPGFVSLEVAAPLTAWRGEAGGHRFQRIPPTERRGRVHTSTVTVAVEDGSRPIECAFSEADVRLEWFSGTGAGGQHRNKHQNSVRAIHEPTGLVAKAECRSKPESLLCAMREIRARVEGAARRSANAAAAVEKRAQVGSGMRGDKVRTYRLQDDTVTDHRTDRRTTWKKVSRGDFTGLATP